MSCYIVKYGTEISHCPSPCSWWCHLKILPEGFRRTSCLKFTEGCCGLKLKAVKDIFCGTQAIENTNSCDEKCCPLFTFDLARRQQYKTTWFVSPNINNNPRFNATCIFELELARTQHLSLKKTLEAMAKREDQKPSKTRCNGKLPSIHLRWRWPHAKLIAHASESAHKTWFCYRSGLGLNWKFRCTWCILRLDMRNICSGACFAEKSCLKFPFTIACTHATVHRTTFFWGVCFCLFKEWYSNLVQNMLNHTRVASNPSILGSFDSKSEEKCRRCFGEVLFLCFCNWEQTPPATRKAPQSRTRAQEKNWKLVVDALASFSAEINKPHTPVWDWKLLPKPTLPSAVWVAWKTVVQTRDFWRAQVWTHFLPKATLSKKSQNLSKTLCHVLPQ